MNFLRVGLLGFELVRIGLLTFCGLDFWAFNFVQIGLLICWYWALNFVWIGLFNFLRIGLLGFYLCTDWAFKLVNIGLLILCRLGFWAFNFVSIEILGF